MLAYRMRTWPTEILDDDDHPFWHEQMLRTHRLILKEEEKALKK